MNDELAKAAGAILGAIVVVVGGELWERRKDRRKEAAAESRLGAAMDDLKRHTDGRLDRTDAAVATLSAHVIGPDGENGLRGDVRELKKDFGEFKQRELERLQGEALHGTPDRRRRRS